MIKLFIFVHIQNKLRNLPRILILLLLFIAINSFCQSNSCEIIYEFTEVKPRFKNDNKELFKYLSEEITPLISNCVKRKNILISRLNIIVTINKKGKVIDANFLKPDLSSLCEKELKTKLLTMKGWAPARHKGNPVCCNLIIPINCIKWE
jgi:hypothetical protein